MKPWHTMTAFELIQAMREGTIGVEALCRYYADRIRRYARLNAVAVIDETAFARARELDAPNADRSLLLFGLPVLVKDNIDVKGLPTTAGSVALADNIASEDADIIKNLRRNGAIILGKTNMTEFANYVTQDMPGGYSSLGGKVLNAYDESADASGSSSGSAVGMSAGLCAAAVGTDTSFSVVACATVNGITGLKPPIGALSQRGIIPIAHTLDSAGALTKDIRDALLLVGGMRDEPQPTVVPMGVKRLRIAYNVFHKEMVSEEQLGKYEKLLSALRADGAAVEDVSIPYSPHLKTIMQCEFKHDLEEYLAAHSAKLKTLREIVAFYEADPERMMKYGDLYLRYSLDETSGKLDDPCYLEAMADRETIKADLIKQLTPYDACLMTGPTSIMHLAGFPSLSIRLGMAKNGMPRGAILFGADENKLYAAALTMERYCDEVTAPKLD